MENLKEAIRQSGLEGLADLIGFASKARFDGLDPAKNPFTLFPEAKTAVVIGRRITRGTLRGIEEGINFGDYGSFGQGWLGNEFLTETMYSVTQTIEAEGWEAMPIIPGPHTGVAGVSEPCDPDFAFAAVAAGLGELGLSGELLTPRFGPRQRVGIILTDAEIDPDALYNKPICTKCGRCAAVCPMNAMGPDTVDVVIEDKVMPVYTCRHNSCANCQNGAVSLGYLHTIMRDAVRETVQGVDRLAAVCNRTCVAALEDGDALNDKFDMKFRQREVWRKNEYGEVLPPLPADKA